MKLFGNSTPGDDIPRRRQSSASPPGQREPLQSNRSVQFRRGQTLTGSVSPNIKSSSNEQSATMMSPRAHVHHLSRKRRGIAWRLLAVIISVLVVYLLVSQLIANVDVKMSSGASVSLAKQSEYNAALQSYYDRYPSQRFYPSLNQVQMTTFMQDTHPEILQAQVTLSGSFGHGQLSVKLRQPIVRWTINGKNEFVDRNGIVFETNGYKTPPVRIVDKTGVSNDQGVITSRRFLSFVGSVVGDMGQKGYSVTEATIPPLTTRQLQLSIKKLPYPIKLTIDRAAGEQTEDASRVIEYLRSKNITPQYIDVRVTGKAFYMPK